ncbi:hypothetical protein BTUL_0116g00450 [Botrytis tulipae]|uniref:Uncharacterized protein n=1 Tax=Botrytis tulipae TaxID=87230 RepID=A0A4Z1EKM9_9HELO|nr:hypothetical protein BTUL_0116g00450 [Botrytis tulipae]
MIIIQTGPGELSPVADLSLTAEYGIASKVKVLGIRNAFCDFEKANEDARRQMHGSLLTVE